MKAEIDLHSIAVSLGLSASAEPTQNIPDEAFSDLLKDIQGQDSRKSKIMKVGDHTFRVEAEIENENEICRTKVKDQDTSKASSKQSLSSEKKIAPKQRPVINWCPPQSIYYCFEPKTMIESKENYLKMIKNFILKGLSDLKISGQKRFHFQFKTTNPLEIVFEKKEEGIVILIYIDGELKDDLMDQRKALMQILQKQFKDDSLELIIEDIENRNANQEEARDQKDQKRSFQDQNLDEE